MHEVDMAATPRRRDAGGEDSLARADPLPTVASIQTAQARKLDAEVEKIQAETDRIRLEAQRIVGELARQPDEARALRMQNVVLVLRIVGGSLFLIVSCLVILHGISVTPHPNDEFDRLFGELWAAIMRLLGAQAS